MALANTLQRTIRDFWSRFPACDAGNVLPLTAGAFLVLAGLVGGGVDISRAYMVKNRLQNACDAGTLAGRKAVSANGYDATAQAEATRFFDINFNESTEHTTGTSFVTVSPDAGSTITGIATTNLPTVIMGIFGVEDLDLGATCGASMAVGNSDVMMVLDTTGSMVSNNLGSKTRLGVLQDAMKSFYDTVDAATASSNARVRYGFVPYNQTINVGRLLPANYLNDTTNMPSREIVTEKTETYTYSYGDPVNSQSSGTVDGGDSGTYHYEGGGYYRDSRDCRRALPRPGSWSNTGSPTTTTNNTTNRNGDLISQTIVSQKQERKEYFCAWWSYGYWIFSREEYQYLQTIDAYTQELITETEVVDTGIFDYYLYKNRDVDVSTYKTFSAQSYTNGDPDHYGNNGGYAVSYTWDGCIEERGTSPESSFGFSSLLGMTPYTWDLDIDTAPNGSANSKWTPIIKQMSYVRGRNMLPDRYGRNGPLNVEESTEGTHSYSICPEEAQLLTAMSKSDFDDYADGLDGDGYTYHDLGMIWGARLSSPDGIFATNVNEEPANGQSVARHIIYMTDGQIVPRPEIHSAFGIQLSEYEPSVSSNGTDLSSRHTSRFLATCEATKAKGIRVWVIAFATALTADLTDCASPDSDFPAANAAQLNAAFQEIADNVGELRITQ